jgi:hypothetical protein
VQPGGQDFLSPAPAEADLMRRVLPAVAFARRQDGFLPGHATAAGCADRSLEDRQVRRRAHSAGAVRILPVSRPDCR